MENKKERWSILLIDDETDIRDVLKISIADFGYAVYTAENGKEGMAIFNKRRPPIVITDIKMPGMDGIELLRHIKQDNPDTEVIMITGHGDMDLAIKSLKFEATDFITKPINIDALEIALKRVTDKIRMKNKLKEYTENLEALIHEKFTLQDHLASLGLMIGSISHGIKGLLTSLDGGIYLLNSGFSKQDHGQTMEGFEAVKFTSGRIKKMVLDILFYAKERELNIEPVNTICFANEVVDVIKPKIPESKIVLLKDFNTAPAELQIDSDFFRSALINILDNAVDACLEDEKKSFHKIVFSIRKNKGHVIFDISDTGIGMDRETKENLFKLFFSSKGGKGTGFGLFISNNIVKQHKGLIQVHSVKGKGTHFSIRIPDTSATLN